MDAVNKMEYRVRDLSTRSVTLFPTRAQVVRDIKDVPLKPGANQITIIGLTPTVDEHSIKVEGTGAAIITDISVELLPNREIFEDIYPDSDDDKSDAEESEEDSDQDEKSDGPNLKAVRAKVQTLLDDQCRAKETVESANTRLKILDSYGKTLDRKGQSVKIDDGLEKYRSEREKVFADHIAGTIRDRELQEEIRELLREESKLLRQSQKEELKAARIKEKQRKIKEKEKEKVRRREEEKRKEKRRVRKELERFWPKQVYTLRISLDAVGSSNFTPSSSRRSSIAGDMVKAVPEKETPASDSALADPQPTCDLSLSYVTSSAFWAPSYDLALSTTANTGQLCFDAQLTNLTSESWTGCKIILSTSQTTFSGLKDAIPVLVPWRVKLAHRGVTYHDILNSREERHQKEGWEAQQNNLWVAQKPRHELFGAAPQLPFGSFAKPVAPKPAAAGGLFGATPSSMLKKSAAAPTGNSLFGAPPPGAAVQSGAFGQLTQIGVGGPFCQALSVGPDPAVFASHGPGVPMQQVEQARGGGGGFGANTGGGLFGGPARAVGGLFGASSAPTRRNANPFEANADAGGRGSEDEADGDDGATMLPEPTPELSFQESSFEEQGLTTTYDLPGLKNLPPSSSASKQRVARVAFTSLVFSHTVVAKYKPAAFLKVKVKNNNKLTLLKGPVGLTLDGSFMGRSTLPRCSAGDTFRLSLGVDPAIQVSYPKPDVKRSTNGLFSKEDKSVYTRSVTIINTRAIAGAKPVTVIVYDQVPVSEDEKLRVEILQPRGLTAAGTAGVAAGLPGRETAEKPDRDWGKATAVLRKAGEITWDVSLNSGKGVKLALEYEVACPAGEHAAQC